MEIRQFLLYTLVLGWAGVVLALLGPLWTMCLPAWEFQNIVHEVLWLTGCGICLLTAAIIFIVRRNPYHEIAALFLVVGIPSLALAIFILEN